MSTSADLGIEYIAGQQAQPEISHNSALNQLQILQTGVVSVALNTPPGSPAQGDSYIIGASPTGAWSGRANCLAGYFGTGWVFVPGNNSAGTAIAMGVRHEGLSVWSKADNAFYVWNGSAWAAATSGMTNPMTTSGDVIYGGASGAPTRLAAGTNGYVLTMVAGIPAWVKGQSGMATATATLNDFPFYTGPGGYSSSAINSTTRCQLSLVYLDSPLTFTDIVIAVRTATAATTLDIGIYNFLGAGKPGTCAASAQFSTAATGRIAVTLGAPVTLSPGLYYVVVHGSSASPTIATYTQTTNYVEGPIAGLAISDAMTQIAAGTTTLAAVLFNDSSLPGGSYTRGMDLTGMTMSSANIVGYNTWVPVVALKKQ